ncbi:11353_t:CDS:1 [Cetraspora pellucida]|uniref:11353_t:CDS:1 n=1 Tax=Cetraspora pellucida TaxID=1433469 RepID=A0ACA9R018_9GLOM|nr:11353_t:CDS:1 [Cetraspora pellucida]
MKQEIKEIKEKLENNDKPDRNPPPTSKTEVKLRYVGEADNEEVAFNNFFGKQNREDLRLFYISRNHPQIKELMSQGKLQLDRAFIARYGKVDHISPNNLMHTFNENNQELEIREA